MIHFFCSTPLQIYTAIILSRTDFKNEKKTIYIIDYFSGNEKYKSRIEQLGIFERTKVLHIYDIYEKIKMRKRGWLRFLFYNFYYFELYEKVLRNLQINVSFYDAVFFSYLEPVCLMLTKLNIKRKLHLRFYGFEDGIGAYTLPLDRPPTRKLERYLGKKPFYNKECYWVYRPEFVLDQSKRLNVKSISLKLSKELQRDLSFIWSEAKDIIIDRDVVFFDDIIMMDSIKGLCAEVSKYKEKIIVKKHPRRMDLFYEDQGYAIMFPQSVPFESILIEKDISDKVLINVFSSAAVNSVFMFNQRPTLIFLYELVDDSDYRMRLDEIRKLVNDLRMIYNEDDKIIVPKTMKEYKSILCNIIK